MRRARTPTEELTGGRRVLRWMKRIVLGLLAFVVVAIATVLIVIHTDWGRSKVRAQVEAVMADTFVGGASLGKLEGSPFGELVARDLVINGPDGKPAIVAKTARIQLSLTALIDKRAILDSVVIEDAEITVTRDADGELNLANLTAPGPKSGWHVELRSASIRRANIAVEGQHFDAMDIDAVATIPAEGPIVASAVVRGTWREKAAPVVAIASVSTGDRETVIPSLFARVGGVVATASDVTITQPPTLELWPGVTPVVTRPDLTTTFAGHVAVNAPKLAVLQLVPQLALPGDVEVVAHVVSPSRPWTQLEVHARVAGQTLVGFAGADLTAMRFAGVLATGSVDVGVLSMGRVQGRGTALIGFDAYAPVGDALPVGTVMAMVSGEVADAPYANVAVLARSTGERAVASIGATGEAAKAAVTAIVTKRGEVIRLERGTLVASTTSPECASEGRAPVEGRFDANLTASGALAPSPNLAVAGRIDGSRLAVAGVSVRTLKLGIDATGLPARPAGRAELFATNVARGDIYLRELGLTAGTRPDGKVAVALRTRPKQDPYLVEADALVDLGTTKRVGEAPGGLGEVITIDLQRHRVKAGSRGDWSGTTGLVTIDPTKITLRDFQSSSGLSKLVASAEYVRAGRRAGDLVATAEIDSLDLDTLHEGYAGTLGVTAKVTRTNGLFAGDARLQMKAVSFLPTFLPFDLDVSVSAAPDRLTIDGSLKSMTMGDVTLAADVDAPRDITNVKAWQALGRDAIRTGRLRMNDLELSQFAELASLPPEAYRGKLSGDVQLSATTLGGRIQLKQINVPQLRGVGEVNADIELAQTGPRQLTPTIVATVDNIGKIDATATIDMPEKLFAPAAWGALGRDALRGAKVSLREVQVDPAMFERFGIVTDVRGRVTGSIEVTAGAKTARAMVRAADVHGSPIAQPLTLDANVVIDEVGTSAAVTLVTLPVPLTAQDKASAIVIRRPIELVTISTKLPVTMTELQANPGAIMEQPLNVTASIPDVPAAQLLAIFGRTEVSGGRLTGTVDIKGTIAAPEVRARLAMTDLAVSRVVRGRRARGVKRMTIDATYGNGAARIEVDGVQDGGSLHLLAVADLANLAAGKVDVEAKNFDLAPLLAFAPGPAGGASGTLEANLKVAGLDPRTAKLAGELHLVNARVPIAPEIGTLRRAKVDIVVGPTQAKVTLDGRLGGGSVKLAGTFVIAGTQPQSGEVTMQLRKISPIGAIEPDIDADVAAKLHIEPGKWVADVNITKGNVVVPDDRDGEVLKEIGPPEDMVFLESQLSAAERRKQAEAAKAAKPQGRSTFTANVVLGPTYIKSTELRGIVRGKLRVDVDANANLAIVGAINADRGDLDLFGRRYQVDRAGVRFDGSIDPLLDVAISHDFPDVTTVTVVRGRVSKPEILLSSTPGTYSQGQLLGFLLGGEPTGEPSDGNPRDKVTSAGASLIGNQLGGYVKDALPFNVDVLKYEAATSTNSQAVTVGTWLTRNLFLAYRQRVGARADENNGEAELEYYLTRRLVIEGVVGDKNRNGIDLLWRKRY